MKLSSKVDKWLFSFGVSFVWIGLAGLGGPWGFLIGGGGVVALLAMIEVPPKT